MIWVVGHGDPENSVLARDSKSKAPPGDFLYNPLWAGASIGWEQAVSESPELNDLVELKPGEDHHSPSEAADLAKTIRGNPSSLAVIGHDQSNTTAAAEPIYADAGIPVIFAAATSPEVGSRYVHRDIVFKSNDPVRAVNFVRLPPPDVPFQSHALRVATFAIAKKRGLGSDKQSTQSTPIQRPIRVYVVRETSHNAEVYSGPIGDALQKDDRFSRLVVGERRFDRDQLDVYTLVTSIRGSRADLVVFIGYPESALDLLQEMKERIRQDQSKGPSFLFTDACLTTDVADRGFPFDIYVTSSTLTLNECDPPKKYEKALENLKKLPRPVTSEVYAADAILLLSQAVEHCRQSQNVGRQCVMRYIREQRDIDSVCRPYHIDEGESGNGLYLLYARTRGAKALLLPKGFIRTDHEQLLADTRLP